MLTYIKVWRPNPEGRPFERFWFFDDEDSKAVERSAVAARMDMAKDKRNRACAWSPISGVRIDIIGEAT